MLHKDDMIMDKIITKRFFLFPDKDTVKWLRALAKEYKKGSDNKKNRVLELLEDYEHYILHSPHGFGLNKLTKLACYSAVSRIRNIGAFEYDYNMYSMFLQDAADHLEVAILLANEATPHKVYKRLWDMDTASRDEMAGEVWEYATGEYV